MDTHRHEVTAQQVDLAAVPIKCLTAVVLVVHKADGQLFGVLADHDAVDKDANSRNEEDEEQEEDVPLHRDGVLDEQGSDIGQGGEDDGGGRFLLLRSLDEGLVESVRLILTD